MLVKKSGIVRDIAESRLHEYKAKGYTPLVVLVEETPIEPVPSTDTGPKKRPKKPAAKE